MNSVIVGLDDSPTSRAAMRWAAGYARATGRDLCAVHVLDWPIGLSTSAVKSGIRLCVPRRDVIDSYWHGLHRVFDDISFPPGSTLQIAQGNVGDVLVRLSRHANLLVVGTREPIRERRYVAGSVSHYCISHASCPVVTVPEAGPGGLTAAVRHHDNAVPAGGQNNAATRMRIVSRTAPISHSKNDMHPVN